MVWAKIENYLREIRGRIVSQVFLSNLERLVESSAYAQERLVVARQTVARLRERMLAPAKA